MSGRWFRPLIGDGLVHGVIPRELRLLNNCWQAVPSTLLPDGRVLCLDVAQEPVQGVGTGCTAVVAPCLWAGVPHCDGHVERIPVAYELLDRGEICPEPLYSHAAWVAAGENALSFTQGCDPYSSYDLETPQHHCQ